MKILKLHFENINSLAGKWTVDFTQPDFVESGLFAIVGPTGSGKSSILDAMTLGLYGQTPRQKSVSSENEVMTYGTVSCFAEVLFEVHGDQYRSCFEQKRAHKKVDGKLQAPRFSLYKIEVGGTEEPLTEKIKETSDKIIELVGLDYEQFTKAVLLPQGAFSRFLTSADGERAKILEQISGSGKYRKFSIKTYEREKKERAELALIEKEITGAIVLSPEDEETLLSKLKEKEILESKLEEASKGAQLAVEWIGKINKHQKNLLAIEGEIEAFKNEEKRLAPEKEKCEKARRALEIDSFYNQYEETEKNIATKTKIKEKAEKEKQGNESELKNIDDDIKVAGTKKQEQQKLNASKVSLWDEVKEKDILIANKQKTLKAVIEKLGLQKEKVAASKKTLQALKEDWEKECSNLVAAREHIDKNKEDDVLVSQWQRIEYLLEGLEKKLAQTQKEKGFFAVQKQALEALKKNIDFLKTKHQKTKEEREHFLENELDSLSTLLRDQLKNDLPCPVCGGLEHPYCQTHTIGANQNIAIQNVERLKGLQQQIEKENRELIELEAKYNANVEAEGERAKAILALEGECQNQQDEAQRLLSNYSVSLESIEAILVAKKMLLKKKTNFEKCKVRLEEHKEKEHDYKYKEQENQNALTSDLAQQKELEEAKAKEELELSEEQQNRKTLFGEKTVEEDRRECSAKLDSLEKELKQKETQASQIKNTLASLISTIQSALKDLKEHSIKAQEHKINFEEGLIRAGFSSKEAFIVARMDPDECRSIEKQIQENQDQLNKKSGELESAQKEFQTEKAKALTDKTLEELEKEAEEIKADLQREKNEKIELTLEFRKHKENQKKVSSLQNKLEKQHKVHRIWDSLSELIGSANGDKLAKFVQGITLKTLTASANQHLKKLNPRYFLTAHEKDLALLLHDNDFGEVRPTSNISGGETFQISLSLALGLSSMASHRVRIDTLFLDEGFGTLDSKTLQSAISLLSNLRQEEGKLIGIITHVESLKEEIETQINVQPISNGHSIIKGPGVKKG